MAMILITGGAGYIGSHCTLEMKRAGFDCVVLDNLTEGHKEAIQTKDFCLANLGNIDEIRKVFRNYKIDAVIHFAASCYVGESTTNPQKYYYNNVVNTLNLLQVMVECNVKNIVFSSTCATYGNPEYTPIDETHTQKPINVYGKTKLMIEHILQDYDRAYGLKYMALRYFNASGADNKANIGESHDPETHLIPLVLQVALGKRESIKVFGNDYDTPDGTCIRDYIHVNDLSSAHRLALEKLFKDKQSNFYNLGTGKGCSVNEVIRSCEEITRKTIKAELAPRREGDPPTLFADNKKALKELGWQPEYTKIDDIILTAWNWEKNRRY
ncbi:MAG: UDP-glucose 4-epimerase GalE [Candidatus Melainabacteria bacterium GWF2_37_15]|nr:MAG: UDP-glucose 4-epimerase GalE [Candidatus Melainabacteria bacterium GWF2_37_15]